MSKGQLIGVIVAAILGLIFVLVLIMSLWLYYKNRRNRREQNRFSMIAPIETEYHMVEAEIGVRRPGEGSPSRSGGEADPFLQASRSGSTAGPIYPGSAAYPVPSGSTRRNQGQGDSSLRSSATGSGYGVPVENPTWNFELDGPPFQQRHIMTQEQLARLDEENLIPEEDDDLYVAQDTPRGVPEYSPLMAPPRLVDPKASASQYTQVNRATIQMNNPFEDPMQMKAEATYPILPIRSGRPPTIDERPEYAIERNSRHITPASSVNSILRKASFLLDGLANITRLSWFKSNTNPSSGSLARSYPRAQPVTSAPFSDDDLEAGQALLSPVQMGEKSSLRSFGYGPRASPISRPVSAFDRPTSGLSHFSAVESQTTVYHDAMSSAAGTPTPPLVVPPPRAAFMGTAATSGSSSPELWARSQLMAPSPPFRGGSATPSSMNTPQQAQIQIPDYDDVVPERGLAARSRFPILEEDVDDVLNMPPPSAVSPFNTTTGSSSLPSLTADMSSFSARASTISPATPIRQTISTATDSTVVPVKYGSHIRTPSGSGSHIRTPSSGGNPFLAEFERGNDISIDVLEEEPPAPQENWRSMAAIVSHTTADGQRRTTFGPVQVGALPVSHLSADHLSEHGPRSGNSSGASSGSYGSSSSKGRSVLSHSGSITSDGRKQRRRPDVGASNNPPEPTSPALSAFGPQHAQGPSGAGSIGSTGIVSISLSTTTDENQIGSPHHPQASSGGSVITSGGRITDVSPLVMSSIPSYPSLPTASGSAPSPPPAAHMSPGSGRPIIGDDPERLRVEYENRQLMQLYGHRRVDDRQRRIQQDWQQQQGGQPNLNNQLNAGSPVNPAIRFSANPWATGLDETWSPKSR